MLFSSKRPGSASATWASQTVLALVWLLLVAPFAQAYDRIVPRDWSPADNPGSTGFLPRQCTGDGADGITKHPTLFGYWLVVGHGGRPSEPDKIQARVLAFANGSCSDAGACSTPVTFSGGACEVSGSWSNGDAVCRFQSTRMVSPRISTGPDNQPVCEGTPVLDKRTHTSQFLKTCNKVPNIHYDTGSGECVCDEGVYDPAKNSCVPVVDRVISTPCDTCHGSSLVALTGARLQPVEVGDIGGMPLTVTFNSVRRVPYADAAQQPFIRSDAQFLGADWKPSFERRVLTDVDKALSKPAKLINVLRGDGNWTSFVRSGTSYVPASASLNDRLVVTATGYLYVDANAMTIEEFNKDGVLTRLTRLNGGTLDVTRSGGALVAPDQPDADALPVALTDETGRVRQLRYAKGADGVYRLSRIEGAGVDVQFNYDTQARLAGLTYADGATKTFLYEDTRNPWALTGYLDERQVRAGTYAYDAEGRATSTSRANGLDAYAVSWTTAPKWGVVESYDSANQTLRRDHVLQVPQGVRVSYPNSDVETLSASGQYGSVKWTERSRGSSGGTVATERRVLDQNLNVTRYDDANGNRRCASFDLTRNLETARVEGLATTADCASVLAGAVPAGARKVSSQWHPTWRLATRTAEPRRITTLVYNGQPDPLNGGTTASCAPADAKLPDGTPIVVLCKRVEQATTDDTGAQGFSATLQAGVATRATSWTYNATGQVLTETDARGKVVATNVYYTDTTADHTKGDLQSTTNAREHVVQFPRYAAFGKPLESVDANGISTVYAYDARQRLSSATTLGKTTGYTYWPTGQVKQVTQTDGGAVNYEYDDAQRLAAVFDSLGNRVEYTLDASGNRTDEKAKDPQGTLKRSMNRVFDALGRAQQTTGRE